jgi:hypothetical protein
MKIINRCLKNHPFWSGWISLCLLLLGALYFHSSVIVERYANEEVANHNPNTEPGFFWGRLKSSPLTGHIEFKDRSGGIVRFPSSTKNQTLNFMTIIEGYLNPDRTIHILQREDHANIILKFVSSALALGFLLWKLFQIFHISKKGLRLAPRKQK